jgi:hypothetical protein
MTRSRGYAVLDDKGNILVRTITDSERGAKVNWLGTTGGLRVTSDWPDAMVAEMFERLRGGAYVVEVEVKVRKNA